MNAVETFSDRDLTESPLRFSEGTPPVRFGIFGDPVAHSLSPVIQNAAFEACGIPARYARLHVASPAIRAAVRALPAAGFLGANVTFPHKAAVLAAMDEVDDYARQAGAVNTISVEGGHLKGFNTDGPGLVRAIREEFSVDLRDLRVILLGAGGGAGRAIAVQCARESCERLVLVNRTFDKASQLAKELAPMFRSDRLIGPADRLVAIPFEDAALRRQLQLADLVINATTLGMKRGDPPALAPHLLTANLMVFDTVYAAGVSRLLEDAAAAGARCANGLGMLLHQGALAFEIWTNRPAPLEVMRQALHSRT